MSEKKPMVLIVDDNDTMRKLLVLELGQDTRLRIENASTGEEGLRKAADPECVVIVLDMMLPDTDGLQFIERLKELRGDNPPSVSAITGASQARSSEGSREGEEGRCRGWAREEKPEER